MSIATPILQIIDRDPVAVDRRQKISDAVRALSSERFHHLPIVDDGKLVGLLSSADVLKLHAKLQLDSAAADIEALDRHYSLDDVMQKDVITLSHMATVGDAARTLSAGGFHALPVVDGKGHLLGIVTTTDLVGHMLDAEPEPAVPREAKDRLSLLEAVLTAAQHYLHSGMGAQEHARLERAIEAARKTSR